MRQVDMFVDAEDRRLFEGVRSLEIVIARLPSAPFLSPSDIACALNTKADTVYRWIDSGRFEVMDLGSGATGRPRYRIERVSFLRFLRGRVSQA